MWEYLSKFAVSIVADWLGQFYIRKAIVQKVLLDNQNVPEFVMAFLPIMGPLYVSLNARQLVFLKNSFLFHDLYKSIFGSRRNLGQKPRPWQIDLILYIIHLAWFEIVDFIYLKFGYTCKNIEFLYLTNLFNNLIPLVLDVYAIHYREGNWLAYEDACMRCWSDLFLQFDRKNYKRAPIMFFSDIFYWMETGHPIINMIIDHLASLSDCPVELFHSIVRRHTTNSSTAQQLRSTAHLIYQQRHNNDFQQHFVHSVKYPYSPKQLWALSQKCAIEILEMFAKIYRAPNQNYFVIDSSNNINTYKLLSLGYEITDCHLLRGFVTLKKPDLNILCDSTYCNYSNDLSNESILAWGMVTIVIAYRINNLNVLFI
ncbi:hypothetical protein C2G38_2042552 [Gigaspora rosea]|uniref:Uncharacterized protein n=1 Tax=Gigaspora rosea TaxID=44941 RepID=A0A397UN71_9GLOM|nr:hypothetical protein C2G38_2042552 [Gigaspora rosea]